MNKLDDLIELRDGWIWPKSDIRCWRYMQKYPNLPNEISEYVIDKKVVIQAGGNCGVYPKKYAAIFDTVYTFEPEWLNFYCLSQNATEENIIKTQACLGNEAKLVNLNISEKNRGKNYVSGLGKYPTYLIDNIGLDVCNLIHLDIEGYEYFALKGAESTIKKCLPVIVIEMFDELSNRFDINLNQKTEEFLDKLNYKLVKTFHGSDKLYVHSSIIENKLLNKTARSLTIRNHQSVLTTYLNSNTYYNIKNLYSKIRHILYIPKMEFYDNTLTIRTNFLETQLHLLTNLTKKEKEIIKSQIIDLIKLLYEKKISHRDIHTKNIFWDGNQIWLIDWEYVTESDSTSIDDFYDLNSTPGISKTNPWKIDIFSDHAYSIKNFLLPEVNINLQDFKK